MITLAATQGERHDFVQNQGPSEIASKSREQASQKKKIWRIFKTALYVVIHINAHRLMYMTSHVETVSANNLQKRLQKSKQSKFRLIIQH